MYSPSYDRQTNGVMAFPTSLPLLDPVLDPVCTTFFERNPNVLEMPIATVALSKDLSKTFGSADPLSPHGCRDVSMDSLIIFIVRSFVSARLER